MRTETPGGLGLYLGGLGVAAGLALFAPILAASWLGGVGLVLAGLGALLHLGTGPAAGRSLGGSLVELVGWGGLLVVLLAGLAYMFQVYVPAHGGLLGGWVQPPMPRPTPGPRTGLYDW